MNICFRHKHSSAIDVVDVFCMQHSDLKIYIFRDTCTQSTRSVFTSCRVQNKLEIESQSYLYGL